MAITFDTAVEKYLQLKHQIEQIDAEASKSKAPLKEQMGLIEAWITAKAQEEGLPTVNAKHGTAYWSTHTACSVADVGAFREFAINECPDLLETRASRTAVTAYLEHHKQLPPGVNYSTRKVFNVRPKAVDEA